MHNLPEDEKRNILQLKSKALASFATEEPYLEAGGRFGLLRTLHFTLG